MFRIISRNVDITSAKKERERKIKKKKKGKKRLYEKKSSPDLPENKKKFNR